MWTHRYNDTYISGKPDTQRTLVNRRTINRRQSIDGGTAVSSAFERPFADIVVCMCVCNKASISTSDNMPRVFSSANLEVHACTYVAHTHTVFVGVEQKDGG